MLLVGLTGGIGSGKTTVAHMLERRGAVVVDADDLARRAIQPGTDGHRQVVEAFGDGILTDSGEIDRPRLGRLVFAEDQARQKLEAIVHPEVARLFAEEASRHRQTDRIVVYVVPLLAEVGLQEMFDVVLVVRADPETRVARLAASREMAQDDIRLRMGAQLSDEEREDSADVVLRNDGSLESLEGQVTELWDLFEDRVRGSR